MDSRVSCVLFNQIMYIFFNYFIRWLIILYYNYFTLSSRDRESTLKIQNNLYNRFLYASLYLEFFTRVYHQSRKSLSMKKKHKSCLISLDQNVRLRSIRSRNFSDFPASLLLRLLPRGTTRSVTRSTTFANRARAERVAHQNSIAWHGDGVVSQRYPTTSCTSQTLVPRWNFARAHVRR